MNKKLRKITSIALAAMMCMAMTVPVSAIDASEGAKGYATIDKHLVMNKDANVPDVSFEFTISAGNAQEGGEGKFPIYAGIIDGVKTGTKAEDVALGTTVNVDFNNQSVTDTDNSDGKVKGDLSDKKYATGNIVVDFSGVDFKEPGVYRYIIKETPSTTAGITDDEDLTRAIDVYVIYDEATEQLKISAIIVHADPTAAIDTNGVDDLTFTAGGTNGTPATGNITNDLFKKESDYKSQGFRNDYDTYDLQFSKTVTGNQGSRDKYFAFTVTVEGLKKGDEFTVDISKASASPEKNTATKYTTEEMSEGANGNETIIVTEGTSFTKTYYLHHDQSITIKDLPAGATWTITEVEEDYKPSYTVTEGNEGDMDERTGDENTVSDNGPKGIEGNTTVTFTNTRSGTVPTGILMTVAPFAGLMVVGIAGAAVILNKKKKND